MITSRVVEVFVASMLVVFSSCSDFNDIISYESPMDSTASSPAARQIPGCIGEAKLGSGSDSCFTYVFEDTLFIRFCARANCCPDHDRFSFDQRTAEDTIYVMIADTARHGCRCMCMYVLAMEFAELERDSYVFHCTQMDSLLEILLYSIRVERARVQPD